MKNKRNKKWLVVILGLAMIAVYGFVPPTPQAGAVGSIYDAKDLITNSGPGVASTTHYVAFTTASTTPQNGYWRITFPAEFTNIAVANVNCSNGVAAVAGQYVRCNFTGGPQVPVSATTTISGITNPSLADVGTYYIEIENFDNNNNLLERVRVAVVILESVLMTARVDSTLTFTVSGMANTETVNGVNCDKTTTSTTTPFGTLGYATTTVCQKLNVTTNATDGYAVTVEQDGELTTEGGATINSFNNSPDGTGSTTPGAWKDPTGILDQYNTYGHMGVTSNDDDLVTFGYNDYYQSSLAYYVGFNSTNKLIVMHHDGPADGTTQNKGVADIAYSVKITALQEAGDYTSVLTYICTPTF